jgi:hypothetical protein
MLGTWCGVLAEWEKRDNERQPVHRYGFHWQAGTSRDQNLHETAAAVGWIMCSSNASGAA